MSRILIVDDEQRIREVIHEYGKISGYTVDEASDGLQAVEMTEKTRYDCIILDIMMPNLDGFSTCKKIKEHQKKTPIIMLTARQEEYDKLYGFELGIDDYVVKPFSPKELMARIKVVIERNSKPETVSVIEYDGLKVNITAHAVEYGNTALHLANKEFDLLVYLMQNPNMALSRDTLLEKIWDRDGTADVRAIDTHIKMLRADLKDWADHIVTVRGVGYKFDKK